MSPSKLSITLLFISILVVTVLAFLIKPLEFSLSLFFSILGWIYFLVFINWYSLIYTYSDTKLFNQKHPTIFGVLPSIGVQTILFTIVSIVITLVFLTLNNFEYLPLKHWFLQLSLFGILLISIVLTLIASKSAELPQAPNNLVSKEKLVDSLNQLIIKLSNHKNNELTIEALNLIKDAIKYSIPHLSVLKDTENYNFIQNSIDKFHEKINKNEDIDIKELNIILDTARICK